MYQQILQAGLTNAILGTLLAILVWGTFRITKNCQLASILWIAVLLKFITPPFVELALLPVDDVSVTQISIESEIDHDSIPVYINPSPEIIPDISEFESDIGEEVQSSLILNESEFTAEDSPMENSEPEFAVTPLKPEPTAEKLSETIYSLYNRIGFFHIFIVWITGSLICLTIMLYRGRNFEKLLSQMQEKDHSFKPLADEIAQRMGMSKSPVIRVLEAPITPMIWAFGKKPVIVLPAKLSSDVTREKLSMILAHELAHIKRKDYLLRWVELAVLVLFWWFPIVRWIRKEWHAVQEECCDAWVIQLYPQNRVEYGETLLTAAQFLQQKQSPVWANELWTKSSLKERIETMLKTKTVTPLSRSVKLATLLILGPLLVLSIGQVQKKPVEEKVIQESVKTDQVIDTNDENIESNPEPQNKKTIKTKEETIKLANHLVDGWFTERQKLKRGKYICTNDILYKNNKNSRYELNDRIDVSFDYEKNLLQQNFYEKEKLARFIMKKPDAYYRWTSGSHVVNIKKPSDEVNLNLMYEMEIRGIGISSYSNIESGESYDELTKLMTRFRSATSVESLGDGRYQLVYDPRTPLLNNKDYSLVDILTINTKKGFSIEERKISSYNINEAKSYHDQLKGFTSIQTEWKSINGIWVPVKMKFDEPSAFLKGTVNFEWKNVNEELGDEIFDLAYSNLPGSTLVADSRESNQKSKTVSRLEKLRKERFSVDNNQIESNIKPVSNHDSYEEDPPERKPASAKSKIAKRLIDGWFAEQRKLKSGEYDYFHHSVRQISQNEKNDPQFSKRARVTFDEKQITFSLLKDSLTFAPFLKYNPLLIAIRKRPDDYYRYGTGADLKSLFRPSYSEPTIPLFSEIGTKYTGRISYDGNIHRFFFDKNRLQYPTIPEHIAKFESLKKLDSLHDGRYRLMHVIKLNKPGSPNQWKMDIITINEKKGFSIEERNIFVSSYETHKDFTQIAQMKIQSKQLNGLWLPVVMQYESPSNKLKGFVQFNWLKVNQDLEKHENGDFKLEPYNYDHLRDDNPGEVTLDSNGYDTTTGTFLHKGREVRIRYVRPHLPLDRVTRQRKEEQTPQASQKDDSTILESLLKNIQQKDPQKLKNFINQLTLYLQKNPDSKTTEKILAVLLEVLNDDNKQHRIIASGILSEYCKNNHPKVSSRSSKKIYRNVLDSLIIRMNQDSDPMVKFTIASYLKSVETRACSEFLIDMFYNSEGIEQYYTLGLMQSMSVPWETVKDLLVSANRKYSTPDQDFWETLSLKLVKIARKKTITDKEYQAAFKYSAMQSLQRSSNRSENNERVEYFRQEITEVLTLAFILNSSDLTEAFISIADQMDEEGLKVMKNILQLSLGNNKFGLQLMMTDEVLDLVIKMIESDNNHSREIGSFILKHKLKAKR